MDKPYNIIIIINRNIASENTTPPILSSIINGDEWIDFFMIKTVIKKSKPNNTNRIVKERILRKYPSIVMYFCRVRENGI